MTNFSGGEILIITFLALVLIGPDRLPEYARQLARLVRRVRELMSGATTTLKEELGEEYAELAKLDPRQYDPRRIVRDALLEDVVPANRQAGVSTARMNLARGAAAAGAAGAAGAASDGGGASSSVKAADQLAPFDDEAT